MCKGCVRALPSPAAPAAPAAAPIGQVDIRWSGVDGKRRGAQRSGGPSCLVEIAGEKKKNEEEEKRKKEKEEKKERKEGTKV